MTLSLDPGFRTGWARSDGRTGILDLSVYEDHGHAAAVFHDWLDKELTRDRPISLAVERAIFTGRMKHADLTLALIRIAHMVAWSHDVPRTEKTAQEVRGWLVGKYRGATDAEVIAAVNARGFRVTKSHEADAAALLCACECRQIRQAA
jgi:Holliday junction resolvasome RuvABC endonuclease subunit